MRNSRNYFFPFFAIFSLGSFSWKKVCLFENHMLLTWQSVNRGSLCQRLLINPWTWNKQNHVCQGYFSIFQTNWLNTVECYDFFWIQQVISITYFPWKFQFEFTWSFQRLLTCETKHWQTYSFPALSHLFLKYWTNFCSFQVICKTAIS